MSKRNQIASGLAAAGLAALAAGLTFCSASAAPAPPPGFVFVAGQDQLRELDALSLAARGQWRLSGDFVAAGLDTRGRRLELLLGGGVNALEALPLAANGSARMGNPVSLGLAPAGFVLDHAQVKAYVAGMTDNGGEVAQVDLARGVVTRRMSVGRNPTGVVLNAAGTLLLVGSSADASITVAIPETLHRLRRIGLHAPPRQLVSLPFGDKAFALCGDEVAVIDARTGDLLTYLPVGPRAQALQLKPDGGELYVSNAAGTVSVIDTGSNVVSGTMAAGLGAGAMTVSPDGATLYVANADAGTISVIDLGTRSMLAVVRVGERPTSLELGAGGEYLFAADSGSGDLAVVRTNQDPTNPNTLVTLAPAPPQVHGLVAGAQPR